MVSISFYYLTSLVQLHCFRNSSRNIFLRAIHEKDCFLLISIHSAMAVSYTECNELMKALWDISVDMPSWFQKDIYEWITCQSTILGVPEQYIAFALLVCTAYLSEKTKVVTSDDHEEPMILYALVGGGSGTNKTSVVKLFKNMLRSITSKIPFESGTNDGLLMSLQDNNGCLISLQDEFSSFYENLDKTPSSIEKKKLLSMYNADVLCKATKTGGYKIIDQPHFNIFGFTQVSDLIETAQEKSNLKSGFIQRFMLCVPKDVYVFKKDVKAAVNKKQTCIEIEQVRNTCNTFIFVVS